MELDGFVESAKREKVPEEVIAALRGHWPSDAFLNGPLLSHKTDLKVGDSWNYPRYTFLDIGGKPVKVHYTETATLKSVTDGLALIEVKPSSDLWLPAAEPDQWKQVPLKISGTFQLDVKAQRWKSLERRFEAEGVVRTEKVRLLD